MTGDRPAIDSRPTDAATAAAERDLLPLLMPARPPRPSKPDKDRQRLCVVSRAELPPSQLIRFVADPDDRMVADLAAKLPGRGVWVTATHAAVTEAARRNLFAKSLKRAVKVDKDLANQVENLLVAAVRQDLSLANKAGLVTSGFSKVEITLERGTAVALITAIDASADGAGKLSRKFSAIRAAAGREAPIIQDLTSADLGLAMGGSNVIHASLAKGGLAQRFISGCQRLRDYRMNFSAVPPLGAGPLEGSGAADIGTQGDACGHPASMPAHLDEHADRQDQSSVQSAPIIDTNSDQVGTDQA